MPPIESKTSLDSRPFSSSAPVARASSGAMPRRSGAAPAAADLRRQRVRVAVAHLVGPGHALERHDLVAGRQDRDREARAHQDLRLAEHREHADLGRTEARAGAQHDRAGRELGAEPADVRAARDALRDLDGRARVAARVLDRDDRVGPVGDERPGHDADRGTAGQCPGERPAREALPRDR
jgi:hypothetical protein